MVLNSINRNATVCMSSERTAKRGVVIVRTRTVGIADGDLKWEIGAK